MANANKSGVCATIALSKCVTLAGWLVMMRMMKTRKVKDDVDEVVVVVLKIKEK